MKKTAQQSHWTSSVYLLKKPSPIQRPAHIQYRAGACSWTARQPDTMASVQNKTERESIVITMEPADKSNAAVMMSNKKKAARAFTTRAKKRKRTKLRIA